MELLELRTFDPDDLVIIKLCMKFNLISREQLESLLKESAGKQFILALCDSGILTTEQFYELLRLRKNSIVCPHCQSVNLAAQRDSYLFCSECRQQLRVNRPGQKYKTTREMYGKYRILQEIGRGSVGIVYKARHEQLDRLVALKVLKSEALTQTSLLRFKQEAKVASSLNHPSIVCVYDVGEEHGEYYIAMEYVQGKTLAQYLYEQKPSLKKKVEMVMKVAHGLNHAHDLGIIHRDVKPENIMVTEKGEVKLTDFSLARHVHQENRITQQNMVMGTPIYMSPEQIRGCENLGPATDIYSLGVVFYEMLVGKPPFDHSITATLLHKILTEEPVPPRSIKPGIPKILEEICLKTMAKKEEERFSSAKELFFALKHFLHSEASGEKSTGSKPDLLFPSDESSKGFPLISVEEAKTEVEGNFDASLAPKILPKPQKRTFQDLMSQEKEEQETMNSVDVFLWGLLGMAVVYLIYYHFLK